MGIQSFSPVKFLRWTPRPRPRPGSAARVSSQRPVSCRWAGPIQKVDSKAIVFPKFDGNPMEIIRESSNLMKFKGKPSNLPSGKRLHHCGKSTMRFSWGNSRTKW